MVEFRKTGGPFGDATSNYEVLTDAKTVGEFIGNLLDRKYKDSCAKFVLRTPDGSFDNELCMCYAQDGEIVRRASKYDSLTSLKVIGVKANGGWGSMLYDITIEGELPKQDREEFQMVYFGFKS